MKRTETHLLGDVFVATGVPGFTFENYCVGEPVPVRGNTVVVSTTVVSLFGSLTFGIKLSGSYDGRTWHAITTFWQNAVGYNSAVATAVAYAWVRVESFIDSGTNVMVYARHHLMFMHQ